MSEIENGEFVLKDSGQRQEFDSGAVRDRRGGKGRYDLLPPAALYRVARIFEAGAEKYDARNWERGIPLSRFMDSALRHSFQRLEGRSDEDHAAQAAWNILGFLWTEEMIKRGVLPASLDDMPDHVTVRTQKPAPAASVISSVEPFPRTPDERRAAA